MQKVDHLHCLKNLKPFIHRPSSYHADLDDVLMMMMTTTTTCMDDVVVVVVDDDYDIVPFRDGHVSWHCERIDLRYVSWL